MPVRRIIKFLREQYESIQKRFTSSDKKEKAEPETVEDVTKEPAAEDKEHAEPAVEAHQPEAEPAVEEVK